MFKQVNPPAMPHISTQPSGGPTLRVQLPTGSVSNSAAMCAGSSGSTASALQSPAGPAVAAATPLTNGSDSTAAAGGGVCRTGSPAVTALPCRGDETFEVTVQVCPQSSVTKPASVQVVIPAVICIHCVCRAAVQRQLCVFRWQCDVHHKKSGTPGHLCCSRCRWATLGTRVAASQAPRSTSASAT